MCRAGAHRRVPCLHLPGIDGGVGGEAGNPPPFFPEQVAETLAEYPGFLRVIRIPIVLAAVCRDPDDNMVLECALEGHAQYIVSGDKDLLELKEFRGIRLVRAAEFLILLAT